MQSLGLKISMGVKILYPGMPNYAKTAYHQLIIIVEGSESGNAESTSTRIPRFERAKQPFSPTSHLI
jgi:hypothetical protein